MASKIIVRKDSAADWVTHNPILNDGEPGFESDTLKVKFGNGVSGWTQLPYVEGDVNLSLYTSDELPEGTTNKYLTSTEKTKVGNLPLDTVTELAGKVSSGDTRLTDERTPLDGSVSTAKIINLAVTEAKLSQAVQDKLNGITSGSTTSPIPIPLTGSGTTLTSDDSGKSFFLEGPGNHTISLDSGIDATAFLTSFMVYDPGGSITVNLGSFNQLNSSEVNYISGSTDNTRANGGIIYPTTSADTMLFLGDWVFQQQGELQEIRVDVGRFANTSSTNWNTVQKSSWTADETLIANLINSEGSNTGYGLSLTTVFTGGNEDGVQQAIAEFPSDATWRTWRIDNTGVAGFKLTGLDNNKTYQLRLTATRNGDVSDDHVTKVTANGQSTTYDANDNTSEVAQIDNISPSSGEITIDIESNSGTGNGFVACFVIKEFA